MRMKVLWITNIMFPDICKNLGIVPPVTGGWMKSLAKNLLNLYSNDIELGVACLCNKVDDLYEKKINGVDYYCLPFSPDQYTYNPKIEKYWIKIQQQFNPDVVHIHGTEFAHGLAYMKVCGCDHVVISIQGLVKAYARYSLGSIPERSLRKKRTLYDFLRGHILSLPDSMEKQGMLEVEFLKMAKHVIGRTDWDKMHTWAINPKANYYVGNETLRDAFYTKQWNIDNCEKHTLFLSQAAKPIKGIHKLIDALPLVAREFPDVKVYVAGYDFTKKCSIKDKLRFGTYANYVLSLTKKNALEGHIKFLGLLDEEKMVEQYLKAHLFICPSSIENSPNSLGEAQLLGVPCISSYAGGTPDMVQDNITGLLYRFEEHEMLAYKICECFRNQNLCKTISRNARMVAHDRHNGVNNAKCTMDVYKQVINEMKS